LLLLFVGIDERLEATLELPWRTPPEILLHEDGRGGERIRNLFSDSLD
jgi:hypothetical protein